MALERGEAMIKDITMKPLTTMKEYGTEVNLPDHPMLAQISSIGLAVSMTWVAMFNPHQILHC